MSTVLDPVVPPALRRELDIGDNEGFTVGLLTVADGQWPHQALIGVGEVVVLDDRHLRLATWPTSTATRYMAATARAALTAVVDGVAYTVRVALAPRGELALSGSRLRVFDGRVAEARADTAPYAVLESGLRFRLVDPAPALARWAATRRALRELGPAVVPADRSGSEPAPRPGGAGTG